MKFRCVSLRMQVFSCILNIDTNKYVVLELIKDLLRHIGSAVKRRVLVWDEGYRLRGATYS